MDESQRFWSKVKIGAEDECWEWQAARYPRGYGRLAYSDKSIRGGTRHEYAHRVAYRLTYGEIPEGKIIRHTCDNPPCVNPAHLLSGTRSENNLDSVTRGRWGYRGMPGNQHAKKAPGEGKRPYRRQTKGRGQ